jgi:hypothetical protein
MIRFGLAASFAAMVVVVMGVSKDFENFQIFENCD